MSLAKRVCNIGAASEIKYAELHQVLSICIANAEDTVITMNSVEVHAQSSAQQPAVQFQSTSMDLCNLSESQPTEIIVRNPPFPIERGRPNKTGCSNKVHTARIKKRVFTCSNCGEAGHTSRSAMCMKKQKKGDEE
jgi:predicted RNA-binding Zn-ribbon protein involved in translation (DUF1610 family)